MSEKARVLLVDDDPDFLKMNHQVLKSEGYRVVCCGDLHEALAVIEKERPDLIITDLMMESLDSGFFFSRKIKGNHHFSKIPVIIITAARSKLGFDFIPRSEEELKAMNADAFFDKPVAPDVLLSKVKELLQSTAGKDL